MQYLISKYNILCVTTLCITLCGTIRYVASGPSPHIDQLDDFIHETFDSLIEHVKNELLDYSSPPLSSCTLGASSPCRMPLENEPIEATEMLPYLINDASTLSSWRQNFLRLTKSSGGDQIGATISDYPQDIVKTVSKAVFWESRPVASLGAYNYLQEKMRLHAIKTGRPVTWEAEIPSRFTNISVKESKAMMGSILASHKSTMKSHLLGNASSLLGVSSNEFPNIMEILPDYTSVHPESLNLSVPDTFDAREAFPDCKDVIGHVRDQGACGSCWAMSSTETLNDRLCIASKGGVNALLSTQHTTSCCNALSCLSFGCNGGIPHLAWRWFTTNGVVTGGDYTDLKDTPGKTCWPYQIPNCAHHSQAPYPTCEAANMETPSCRTECLDTKYLEKSFKQDIHKARNAYNVSGVDNIKRALVEGGSLTAAFMVYEDFVMYKRGVYEHVTGGELGGHAVKLIGYGNDGNKPYWLSVNSWNHFWGDEGLFKIAMGACGIDDSIVAGDAGDTVEQAMSKEL